MPHRIMNHLRNLLVCFAVLASIHSSAQQFLVPPFVQPGDAPDLKHERKVIVWQTDSTSANFILEYQPGKTFDDAKVKQAARVTREKLDLAGRISYLYRAYLENLEFDYEYAYRVRLEGRPMAVASFRTRTKHHETNFAAFGDCGTGSPGQAAVAYQVFKKNPDFVLVTGDNVYSSGLELEYRKRYFPMYCAPMANPQRGAPLMQSIPFYTVIGNHDIKGGDLREFPDGMAWFYYNDVPLNGPKVPYFPEVDGRAEQVKAFEAVNGARYPRSANYSFRHGNVHVVVLDANTYVDPSDSVLVNWLKKEFRHHKNEWRIVSYHHPGFNSSTAHYDYQVMRLLSPLLEELGVDLVITGHVHNYQRSVPLKFEPEKDKNGRYRQASTGRVNGTFSLDHEFDGKTKTKPKGIIYITTGAGGAQLYDADISNKPERWEHSPKSNWVPFTKSLISDKYSFTWIQTRNHELKLSQIDSEGHLLDEITVTH